MGNNNNALSFFLKRIGYSPFLLISLIIVVLFRILLKAMKIGLPKMDVTKL